MNLSSLRKGGANTKNYILNEKIRSKEVRLIDHEGKQIGVVPIEEARKLAEEKGLDLLVVSADAAPPVCRIVDFGQYRYEQQKKDKQSKKGNRTGTVKELKMSPKISAHDYQVRLTSAKKFLQKGLKVKLTVFFRGREITHPELGKEVINKFLEDIKEIGVPESGIATQGKIFGVLINPK